MAEQVFHRLPLYRRLALGAADDPDVVARLSLAPEEHRYPNLLLAAVHDVLLAGESEHLSDWYPSVAGQRNAATHRARPVGSGPDDPWPHFRRLALEHDGVAHLLRTRSTQTNEIGRCLTLLPGLFQAGLTTAGAPPGGIRPLGIVEVGASAGLNLRLGTYGYRYHLPPDPSGSAPQTAVIASVASSARLMLDCDLRGPYVPPLPEASIDIASAVGIDISPLSVSDPDDARWLVACQWPEELDRLERLRAAIDLAVTDPPVVEAGDAVHALRRHVLAVPAHALPVVVSTWVLTYLSEPRQEDFLRVLDELGAKRDLAFLYAEQPERVPGLQVPPRPDGQPNGRATALVRMEWRDGGRHSVRLADQHPHGRWLEWLVPSAPDSVTAGSLG